MFLRAMAQTRRLKLSQTREMMSHLRAAALHRRALLDASVDPIHDLLALGNAADAVRDSNRIGLPHTKVRSTRSTYALNQVVSIRRMR